MKQSHLFSLSKILSVPLFITACLSYSNMTMANLFPKESKDDGIWDISITGGYDFQSDNLAIANAVVPNVNNSGGGGLPPFIDTQPEQTWAWGVGLGYIFPSHKFDIQASFNRLYTDKTEQVSSLSSGLDIQRKSNLSYDNNEAEITLGNYFKLHSRSLMRFGYGLQYATVNKNRRIIIMHLGRNLRKIPKMNFGGLGLNLL